MTELAIEDDGCPEVDIRLEDPESDDTAYFATIEQVSAGCRDPLDEWKEAPTTTIGATTARVVQGGRSLGVTPLRDDDETTELVFTINSVEFDVTAGGSGEAIRALFSNFVPLDLASLPVLRLKIPPPMVLEG